MQLDWQILLGPFGLLVGLAIGISTLWKTVKEKDAELGREHEARLADAKQYTKTLVEMTEAMHQTIDRLNPNLSRTNGKSPRE